jgi:hypothetical protein
VGDDLHGDGRLRHLVYSEGVYRLRGVHRYRVLGNEWRGEEMKKSKTKKQAFEIPDQVSAQLDNGALVFVRPSFNKRSGHHMSLVFMGPVMPDQTRRATEISLSLQACAFLLGAFNQILPVYMESGVKK